MKRYLLTSIACWIGYSNLWGMALTEPQIQFMNQYCLECHDSDSEKGDVNLDMLNIDWSLKENQKLWTKVFKAIQTESMPPKKKKQPLDQERKTMVSWLDQSLSTHVPIGRTMPRRLSNAEYENTLKGLVRLPQFKLPLGFPAETISHGFKNLSEGLAISAPLMESYNMVATSIADGLYPPPKKMEKSRVRQATAEDLVLSFSAATVHGDALRLVSRAEDSIMRSCTWPSQMEVQTSGTYKLTISISQFRPKGNEAMILEVRAREIEASDRSPVSKFRFIKDIQVTSTSPETVTFEADLYKGQTLLFRWKNAETTHNPPEVAALMKDWFQRDKRMLAAWQKTVYPHKDSTRNASAATVSLRGLNGWNILKKHLADPKLDMSNAQMDNPITIDLLRLFNTIQGGRFNLADALCHYYHENGPALQIHNLKMEGPLKMVESPEDIARTKRRQFVFGKTKEEKSEAYLRSALNNFLPRAFRGPVDQETMERYMGIGLKHWKEGHSFDEGMHLVLRKILISPLFLFRSIPTGLNNEHQLAARLSYFLYKGPPDASLIKQANQGKVSQTTVLRQEAKRLMPKNVNGDPMIRSFTGQWLDLDRLKQIMPDAKFKFSDDMTELSKKETQRLFSGILIENRPISDFIDPGYTFTTPHFAKNVYGFKSKAKNKNIHKFTRMSLPKGGRLGGLLSQSSIMMTTANGVDTQPVLRGVWMLEKILGVHLPPAPSDVPALAPDTRNAKTPRDLLSAHTESPACYSCHQHIDPVGFVFENFDPVGRWRDKWPKSKTKIDSSGTLKDGTEIKDVAEFKAWLLKNIDQFGLCISEKLMTYATGRTLNYTELKELKAIVKNNLEKEQGFQDLLLDLVSSETFKGGLKQ